MVLLLICVPLGIYLRFLLVDLGTNNISRKFAG
jgi:hypothetical protein